MSVPLVDSFSREEFYSQGKRFVFFVRHTNGDYLISLMAVLEVLYQVQRSELQAHWNILPSIEPSWWNFLGVHPKEFFGFDYCQEGESFIGMCFRILDPDNYFLIEVQDCSRCRHTLSFECFVSILYVACQKEIIPVLQMSQKDKIGNSRDWFEQAAQHFKLPILKKVSSAFLESEPVLTKEGYFEVLSCELFRTEDLKDA